MDVVNKPPCKFGVKCYRKNPKHFDTYSHPDGSDVKQTRLGKTRSKKNGKEIHSKNKIIFGTGNRKNDYEDKLNETSGDGECVQSTSCTLIKNVSPKTKKSSDDGNLKNKSVEGIIKMLFLVDMPPDFYSFYEFYKSVEETHQLKGLELAGLKLVGPFNILSGEINDSIDRDLILCHWRYYYDPPEFQTVLATQSGFHIGYWRDDPRECPVFLASNNPNKNCVFEVQAENIFGSVYYYLKEYIKNVNPFKKVKFTKLQNDLSNWARENKFSLEKKTSKMHERQRKVVSKTFHGAGIVVPVESGTDLGYRPLIETDENLKKICGLITNATDDNEKESLWENLQPLITAANIANDECDFGNSLELGIDLFCFGSPVFHETVEYLLSNAYSLLNRTEFEKIIKAHLKFRRKGNDLSKTEVIRQRKMDKAQSMKKQKLNMEVDYLKINNHNTEKVTQVLLQ